jgi:hypothetical protein
VHNIRITYLGSLSIDNLTVQFFEDYMLIKNRKFLLILCATLSHTFVFAGPPFITDDPGIVDYKKGDFFIAATGTKSSRDFTAQLPSLSADYGAFKNGQLSITVPFIFEKASGQGATYKLGDIQLGAKYCLVTESPEMPQLSFAPSIGFPITAKPTTPHAPLIESPIAGDSENRKAVITLPVWVQKSSDKWTTYGGGSYTFNPGEGNTDFCFFGLVLQRNISKDFWVGVENFFQTKTEDDGLNTYGLNFGSGIQLPNNWQFLCSVGRNTGDGQYLFYAGFSYNW